MKNNILDEIEKNKNYIENFPLETEEGTKKMKQKFKQDSINKRNKYINEQIEKFKQTKQSIHDSLTEFYNKTMPANNEEKYANYEEEINSLSKNFKYIGNADVEGKSGITTIISKMSLFEDKDIFEVNKLLIEFNELFKKMGINLTKEDFKYSAYTYAYMEKFFDKKDYLYFEVEIKKEFEKFFWECPSLPTHLKLNLKQIGEKHKKQIKKYLDSLESDKESIDKYQSMVAEYEEYQNYDIYIITNKFLEGTLNVSDYHQGSARRNSVFDAFCEIPFNDAEDSIKADFYTNVADLKNTVNEYENYNKFKEIIDDLVKKFKEKDTYKGALQTKLKEIKKEEFARQKVCNKYFKLLKKKKGSDLKNITILLNQQIAKLNNLYDELIEVNLNDKIYGMSASASLKDLLTLAYLDYAYLYKKLEGETKDFVKFLYNPNNKLIMDINASSEDNIKDLIYKKYDLINLKLDEGALEKLEELKANIDFILTIYHVEKSAISFKNIEQLCTIKNL